MTEDPDWSISYSSELSILVIIFITFGCVFYHLLRQLVSRARWATQKNAETRRVVLHARRANGRCMGFNQNIADSRGIGVKTPAPWGSVKKAPRPGVSPSARVGQPRCSMGLFEKRRAMGCLRIPTSKGLVSKTPGERTQPVRDRRTAVSTAG